MHAMTKSVPQPSMNKHAALVAQACRRIEASEQPPSLDDLAMHAGLSPFHFHRVFKAATGLTPKAYAQAHRAQAVREGLAKPQARVTDALFDAGYNASSRFYENADAMLGMTPRQFRDGGVDARIEFAIGQSSLGAILVARSQRGVCAISLGDDPDALLRELQDRFPRAELVGGDAPALVEAHGLVGGAVFGAPMAGARGVAGLARFVLEGEDAGEEGLGRWQLPDLEGPDRRPGRQARAGKGRCR